MKRIASTILIFLLLVTAGCGQSSDSMEPGSADTSQGEWELVYAYLTIMPEPADLQARTEVIEGIKAGALGDFHRSVFGIDVIEDEVAEFIRNPQGGGYGGAYSDDAGWEYGSVRVDRVFVAIYRISEFPDREPLWQLAEGIHRRIGKFDQ